ncbi:hypothetical protein GCM10022255_088570 [Dactylosporangium darangshiense]|uniref:Uncharacterized protein n=1 Tax=Dactylosporangium darangshiense TaxID=579108 RepID=A0ABP8DNY3_9ACTN
MKSRAARNVRPGALRAASYPPLGASLASAAEADPPNSPRVRAYAVAVRRVSTLAKSFFVSVATPTVASQMAA